MVKCRNELQEAAIEEAIRLGAEIRYEGMTRDKHIVGVIVYNNQARKIFIGTNKSNPWLRNIIKSDVRKRIEEMKK